jgi:peptide/nickel transport system permease protein
VRAPRRHLYRSGQLERRRSHCFELDQGFRASSLLVAVSVIAEASLSYLGLGTQPPTPSWGLDLNKALGYLQVNLWMALGPGIAILVTATAFNLLGDGLRDLLDPRLRNR